MEEFITDEEMEALPAEPQAAFVKAVRIARPKLLAMLAKVQGKGFEAFERVYRQYMVTMIPIAEQLGIDAIRTWRRPPAEGYELDTYSLFAEDVEACANGFRLALIRRARDHSVALNAATKLKISHLLQEVRSTIDKLEISVAKKDRLFKLLNQFQAEIDRERTTFQAFGALMIELCDDVGEAAKRLEPAVRLVERIGAVMGGAKRAEDAQPRLPAPKPPKRIEGPAKKVDDEIPF